ncbi:hypothetical protein HYE60_07500 [Aggregatibacter actinomycetemcomitans]|nr:hypothetical protein [Aggregatibacter actinomycetemcomitans]
MQTCSPTVEKVSSRNKAIQQAKEHAQVPRNSRGGQDIPIEDLKNYWMEHPDGHPDAGQPGIPAHHGSPHIHAVNSKGEEKIFTW